jgi:type III secretion system YscQ/HrcQ family protein
MTLLRYDPAVAPALVGFPWNSLPALSADEVNIERAARRGILALLDFSRLATVLDSLFVAALDAAGVLAARVTTERRELGFAVVLQGEGLTAWLSLEPSLVTMLLKRVLGQKEGLDAGGAISEPMLGAALSVLAEVCRRVARGAPLMPHFSRATELIATSPVVVAPGAQRAWCVDFFLRLDGRSYTCFAAISGELRTPKLALDCQSEVMRATPVSLNLVVARCEFERGEFESLMVGDVVIPPDMTLDAFASFGATAEIPEGMSAVACSPGAARGLRLRAEGGKLCLAGATELRYDAAVTESSKANASAEKADAQATATDVVMSAPIVVHIELGAVTLPAHAWLSLRPGDVVTSQLPIGRPVTLRIAEQTVAEGELVNVEGHVGVRILRFHGG